MPLSEKQKAYQKEYRETHKEELKVKAKARYDAAENQVKAKAYRQTPEYIARTKKYKATPEYKAKEKKRKKIYNQTPPAKKSGLITNWKRIGVICDDFDTLYERYLNTKLCEECNVELTTGERTKNSKCLDHDHETGKFRNVLCHACNVKRG